MEKIEISLYGVFEARIDGVPIRLPTRRVELILALLALDIDRAVSRSHLAALIWPGQADTQARASLRQAIFRLRAALGTRHNDALEVTPGWLKLRRGMVVLDVDRLETSAALGDVPTGLPLDGLHGFEPEIEDLLHARRSELRQRVLAWLDHAERCAGEARQHAELERLARLHLALDGYDEGALRMLMTALSHQGRRNAALEAFHAASHRIRADLSVSVEPATLELFRSIQKKEQTPATPAAELVATAVAEAVAPEGDVAAGEDPPVEAPPHLRHLAVMHVISERLAAALRDTDPENAEAHGRAALGSIEAAVKREGGKIVGRAGHHLSCVFGVERPDESPSLSAAFAAFEVAAQNSAVALHAGPAIVLAGSECLPLAYIAQTVAEDTPIGTVRLTAPVELACRGAFMIEDMPPVTMDQDLLPTWRLSGEARARGSFNIREARGLSRFVGRKPELMTLADVLGSDGPRAAVVIGEPGIGKSRLLHEFSQGVAQELMLRVQFTRSEHSRGVERFADALSGLFGLPEPLAGKEVLERLAKVAGGPDLAGRLLPPIAGLLGLPEVGRAWIETPRARKFQWLADALLIAFAAVRGREAMLVVEDAHWADEDAQLLLDRLVRSLDSGGPMLVVTQRPEAAHTWAGHGNVRILTLRPLDSEDSAKLLESFHLPTTAKARILGRGGGMPLFLEELARFGTAEDETSSDCIPLALSGLLAHRIDALRPGPRRVMEAAAVIGSEPSDDLLAVLSGLSTAAYEDALSSLADEDLLYRIRSVPQRVYGYKHALLQDAAYQTIPPTRRKALHAAVVARLERAWIEGDRSCSAILADHAARADLARKSIDFAFAAAEDAISEFTFPLADRMLAIAQRSLQRLEPIPDIRRLELRRLQLRLPVLVAYADAESLQTTLSEALGLCRELDDEWLFAFISTHAAFAYQHYDPARALQHADAALAIAEKLGDAMLLRESTISRCQILTFQYKMREALEAIGQHADAWENDRAERDEYLVSRYVFVHYMLSRSFGALGDSVRAEAHARLSVEAAVDNDHPIDRYIAFLAVGDLFAFADRLADAVPAYRSAAEIARNQGHAFFQSYAEVCLGRAELQSGEASTGTTRLRQLVGPGGPDLDPVVRLEAEAALACHAEGRGHSSGRGLENLLRRSESLDLPMIRIALLRALARQEPEQAQEARSVAEAIVLEQGYATCCLSEDISCGSFMEPIPFAEGSVGTDCKRSRIHPA